MFDVSTSTNKPRKRKAKELKTQSVPAADVKKVANNSLKDIVNDDGSSSSSSQDTIIYEPVLSISTSQVPDTSEEISKKKSPYVELPSMDENPILDSIIKNFSEAQEASFSQEIDSDVVKSTTDDSILSFLFAAPSCSSAKDDDVYRTLEDETCSSPENFDKSKLLSELFGE